MFGQNRFNYLFKSTMWAFIRRLTKNSQLTMFNYLTSQHNKLSWCYNRWLMWMLITVIFSSHRWSIKYVWRSICERGRAPPQSHHFRLSSQTLISTISGVTTKSSVVVWLRKHTRGLSTVLTKWKRLYKIINRCLNWFFSKYSNHYFHNVLNPNGLKIQPTLLLI